MINLNKNKGFTLVELVMVIVILGILAAIAVPKFADLSGKARKGVVEGQVGAVRSGLMVLMADNAGSWPDSLDGVANGAVSGSANPFFTGVLQNGVTDPYWKKTAANSANPITYEAYWTSGDASSGTADRTYSYDKTDGSFTY